MLQAVSVPRIEADPHPNVMITDLRARRFADVAVQVQIETPVADRHHIDAPRLRGLAVDAHENGKRLAPAGFEGSCLGGGDEDVRVDAIAYPYDRSEAENCHRYVVAAGEGGGSRVG